MMMVLSSSQSLFFSRRRLGTFGHIQSVVVGERIKGQWETSSSFFFAKA
tara:strand:- start:4744 stop:4890 length:147 start_codon:yes stop_codon:yes gene_type:complete